MALTYTIYHADKKKKHTNVASENWVQRVKNPCSSHKMSYLFIYLFIFVSSFEIVKEHV